MTRILIPRSDNTSAKTIEASDWEKYFDNTVIPNDYVLCGMSVSAQCPNVLAVNISAGKARILGLHLCNSTTCSVTCLTACSTNKIYAQICRDPACEPQGFIFGTTTGCLPTESVHLANAVTGATNVTSVDNFVKPVRSGIGDGKQCGEVMDQLIIPVSTCTCIDYCFANVQTCSSADGCNSDFGLWNHSVNYTCDPEPWQNGIQVFPTAWSPGGSNIRDIAIKYDHNCGSSLLSCKTVNRFVLHGWSHPTQNPNTNIRYKMWSSICDPGPSSTIHPYSPTLCSHNLAPVSAGNQWPDCFNSGAFPAPIKLDACNDGIAFGLDVTVPGPTCPKNINVNIGYTLSSPTITTSCDFQTRYDPMYAVDRTSPTGWNITQTTSDRETIDFEFWVSNGASCPAACTKTTTTSENCPWISFCTGLVQEFSSIMLNLNTCLTTACSLEIRLVCSPGAGTACDTVRTIAVSDFVCGTNRFIALPRIKTSKRHITVVGVGTNKVLSINQFKFRVTTEAIWNKTHVHQWLCPNSTAYPTISHDTT